MVKVNVHTWWGIVTDKEASREVARCKKADASVVILRKDLRGQAGREAHRAGKKIQQYVRENTLPWSVPGWRLLPLEHYGDFAKGLKERIREFREKAERFAWEFPEQIRQMRELLGRLYREGELPTPEEIRSSFRCEVLYMPLAALNGNLSCLQRGALREVKEAVERQYEEGLRLIREHAVRKAEELASRIERSFGAPAPRPTTKLMEEIRNAPKLIRRLNVLEDPAIELAVQELEKLRRTCIADPELVRKNPIAHAFFADTARRIKQLLSSAARQTTTAAA